MALNWLSTTAVHEPNARPICRVRSPLVDRLLAAFGLLLTPPPLLSQPKPNSSSVNLLYSMRRLLMVGLAEAAAEKTMVRSHKGIDGAFVVDVINDGKSGVAVQLEGSSFETVWQLKEGGEHGILNLNKVRYVAAGFVVCCCFCLLYVRGWCSGGDGARYLKYQPELELFLCTRNVRS